jgi:hypothetical protein
LLEADGITCLIFFTGASHMFKRRLDLFYLL